MAALSDVLLVLVGAEPGTAHDIQRRHARAFGADQSVDVTRVVKTLAREERLGSVTTASTGRAQQRLYALTEAGDRRQRAWMLRVPAGAGADDIRVRVLLALAAADRVTYESVLSACVAHLELLRPRTDPPAPDAALSPEEARRELADAYLNAQLVWVRDLRARRRDRDRLDEPQQQQQRA